MPNYAAFDLGHHCLPQNMFTGMIRVKEGLRQVQRTHKLADL